MKLHGKVAIIVGGGSGLGKQTAYEFVKEGCCVMIADINEESCLNTINNIRETFPNMIIVYRTMYVIFQNKNK